MKHKLLFVFALGVTVALHAYVLQATKVKQDVIAVKPQKKLSPIIHYRDINNIKIRFTFRNETQIYSIMIW